MALLKRGDIPPTYFLAIMPSITAPLVYFSCLAGLLTWLTAATNGEPASVARAPIAVVFMVKAGCGGWSEGSSCQASLAERNRSELFATRHNDDGSDKTVKRETPYTGGLYIL